MDNLEVVKIEHKKTVAFDFDGVINSYKSGWQGATVLNDKPVDGIKKEIETLRANGYSVVVYSTRAETVLGTQAIEQYLINHRIIVDGVTATKPIAVAYVDDRAIPFHGVSFGLAKRCMEFKSWTEKQP